MRKVSRRELFSRLGIWRPVDESIEQAYQEYVEKEFAEIAAPHGKPWFTSFHGSAFPASEKSCGRKALYTMMDIPKAEPFAPYGMAIMDAGKDIEERIVQRWHDAGMLLSAPPNAPVQSGFADPLTWLTGSVDAVILPKGWNRPHAVEIKGKDDDKIWKMRKGEMECEEQHRNQLFAYMYGLRHFREQMIPGYDHLDEVRDGSVLYVSRNRPRNTCEFYFEYDEELINSAVEKIKQYKAWWMEGYLPPRPKEWRWTQDPCKWCDFKKLCKADIKADIDALEDSTAIDFAKKHDKTYDLESKRKQVEARWTES
jgi:CRISPR/Cas system-associated exonuclease Cas4 (RecB family)